jgi:hypothetical protein
VADGPEQRRGERRALAHELRQCESDREVDHVVLAQVHERDAQRARVRPTHGSSDGAGLGEDMSGLD